MPLLRWARPGRFARCLCVGPAMLQEQQELTQPAGARANSGQLSGKSFARQCLDRGSAMQAATASEPSMVKTDLKSCCYGLDLAVASSRASCNSTTVFPLVLQARFWQAALADPPSVDAWLCEGSSRPGFAMISERPFRIFCVGHENIAHSQARLPTRGKASR